MRGIKYALAFAWGFLYAVCLMLFTYTPKPIGVIITVPIVFTALSTIFILAISIAFLTDNWHKE